MAQGRRAIGDGFGQVEALARYHAMRQTPRVAAALAEGRLVGVYSGIDRRSGAQSLADLDYVFMPAGELLSTAGRLVDSLVARDGTAGATSKSQYVEMAGTDGAHRLRVATPATGLVGRLTAAEVGRLLTGPLLRWRLADRDWQLLACGPVEFQHPAMVLVCGRPAGQSVYAAATVTPWQAQLVELLTMMRADE